MLIARRVQWLTYLRQLCLQMVIRNLIPIFPHIKIISVNPGLCMSNLSREFKFEWTWAAISGYVSTVLVSRSAEVGARNLSHAAVDDLESTEVSDHSSVRRGCWS